MHALINWTPDDYQKAKNEGDIYAARNLIEIIENKSSTTKNKIIELLQKYPGALVLPMLDANDIKNVLPLAYAELFEKIGFAISTDIRIISKSQNTNRPRMERIFSKNTFSGDVERGREYIIVDDVMTLGGSLNGLRKYIEKNGGKVVACSVLAHRNGGQLSPTETTIEKVYNRHGKEINDKLKSIGVCDDIASLTEWQLIMLSRMTPKYLENMINCNLSSEQF